MFRQTVAKSVRARLATSICMKQSTASASIARLSKPFSITFVKNYSTLKSEEEVKPVFTKLSEENDPERDMFFKYTWGTWLKNDKQEKEKRFTSFSIQGLNEVVHELYKIAKSEESGEALPKPVKNPDNTVFLKENLKDLLGDEELKPDEKVVVKTMTSIHEGKHNRVYKIEFSTGKTFVLRIPYKLLTEYATSRQIQSEAATLDFARYKLGLKVPNVISYGIHSLNPLRSPYILMEYVEGDLLMKKWNPAVEESDPKHKEILNEVIEPLSDFQKKLLSVTFNYYGSLYFYDDVSAQLQMKGEPYSGETEERLKNRWRIGLSTDRNLWRHKAHLKPEQFNPLLGPVDASEPHKVVENAANMEVESLRTRLGLSDADAANKVEDPELLKDAIGVYEKLGKLSPFLINEKSSAIPNVENLFAPRLHNPDIDPLNVIVGKDGQLTFIDFENTTIKPFIYTTSPDFINYEGYKVYNLKEIDNFESLPDMEKYQYGLMYMRTRNQFLWELALNNKNKDLIASVSPYIKELKSPYARALQVKTDSDYLFVEEALLKIKHNWDAYLQSDLVKDDGSKKYPISWNESEIKYFEKSFVEYQKDLMKKPFAATGGWVPQDMFERLLGEGKIEKVDDEYKLKNF